jgi:hypothetical protein
MPRAFAIKLERFRFVRTKPWTQAVPRRRRRLQLAWTLVGNHGRVWLLVLSVWALRVRTNSSVPLASILGARHRLAQEQDMHVTFVFDFFQN